MDPFLHTFIAMGSIFIAYYLGSYLGVKRGVEIGIMSSIDHLMRYDVLTEEDLKTANDRFESTFEEDDDEY